MRSRPRLGARSVWRRLRHARWSGFGSSWCPSGSSRLHADAAIEADRLSIEHRVLDDGFDQMSVLLGLPQSFGKQRLLGQGVQSRLRKTIEQRSDEQAWSDGQTAYAAIGELARDGQGHGDQSTLRGRIG